MYYPQEYVHILFTDFLVAVMLVGSTSRWFKHRILENIGMSVKFVFSLGKPPFSAIRHSHTQDHLYTMKDF